MCSRGGNLSGGVIFRRYDRSEREGLVRQQSRAFLWKYYQVERVGDLKGSLMKKEVSERSVKAPHKNLKKLNNSVLGYLPSPE